MNLPVSETRTLRGIEKDQPNGSRRILWASLGRRIRAAGGWPVARWRAPVPSIVADAGGTGVCAGCGRNRAQGSEVLPAAAGAALRAGGLSLVRPGIGGAWWIVSGGFGHFAGRYEVARGSRYGAAVSMAAQIGGQAPC